MTSLLRDWHPPEMPFMARWPVPPHVGGMPTWGDVAVWTAEKPFCGEESCTRPSYHVGGHERADGYWTWPDEEDAGRDQEPAGV